MCTIYYLPEPKKTKKEETGGVTAHGLDIPPPPRVSTTLKPQSALLEKVHKILGTVAVL